MAVMFIKSKGQYFSIKVQYLAFKKRRQQQHVFVLEKKKQIATMFVAYARSGYDIEWIALWVDKMI